MTHVKNSKWRAALVFPASFIVPNPPDAHFKYYYHLSRHCGRSRFHLSTTPFSPLVLLRLVVEIEPSHIYG